MSSAHTKTGAVGILGLQAGEDVNEKGSSLCQDDAGRHVSGDSETQQCRYREA